LVEFIESFSCCETDVGLYVLHVFHPDLGICDGHALVLYVFITDDDVAEGPVLTYYIPAHD
jgi:hypothetical protein